MSETTTSAPRVVRKVLLSENLADMLPGLRQDYPAIEFVQVPLDGPMQPEFAGADVVLRSALEDDLFNEILRASPDLAWIQITAAGFDWMDGEEFDRKVEGGMLVTRSANSYNVPIAEYVVGALLYHARGFPTLERAQRDREWIRLVAGEIGGSTVGVFGTGAIGQEVAWRLRALGARVVGINRQGTPTEHFDSVLDRHSWAEALPEFDFLVLATPLTPETNGMLTAEHFAAMKQSLILVNVGRGALVVEQDLIDALETGKIAGAVLDAFVVEPLPEDSPLWSTKNVLCTPHTSFRGARNVERLEADFRKNLDRYLAGEPLIGTMKNVELGY